MSVILVDAQSGQIHRDLPMREVAFTMGLDEEELKFHIDAFGEAFTDKWLALTEWRGQYYATSQHMAETRH